MDNNDNAGGGENRTFSAKVENEYVVEEQKKTYVLNVYDDTDKTYIVSKVEGKENEWYVVNQQKWGMVAMTDSGVTFQRLRYAQKYTLKLDETGTFTVTREWDTISYPLGTGNMPLWESDVLRPAFRQLFTDWENGIVVNWDDAANFPDLYDMATSIPRG